MSVNNAAERDRDRGGDRGESKRGTDRQTYRQADIDRQRLKILTAFCWTVNMWLARGKTDVND